MAAENVANGKEALVTFVGDELSPNGERQIEGEITGERLRMQRLQQMFTETALGAGGKGDTVVLVRGDKRTVRELTEGARFRSLSSWSNSRRVARDSAEDGSVCVIVARPSAVLASSKTCEQFSGKYKDQKEFIIRAQNGIMALRVLPAAEATRERILELAAELRKAGLFQFRQEEKPMASADPDASKITDFRTPEADRFLKHPPQSREKPRSAEMTAALYEKVYADSKEWRDDEDLN